MYNIPDPLNFIAVKKIFTQDECNEIIANAGTDWVDGEAVNDTAYSVRQVKISTLPLSASLIEKIKDVVFGANEFFFKFKIGGFVEYDPPQVFRYDNNVGHYNWHNDLGPNGMISRKLSFSIQLSEPTAYTGGQLEFLPSFGKPEIEQGSIIVFPSYLTHRVTPMLSGTRYVIVGWIHGHPFQ